MRFISVRIPYRRRRPQTLPSKRYAKAPLFSDTADGLRSAIPSSDMIGPRFDRVLREPPGPKVACEPMRSVGLLSLGDLITDPITGVRRTHGQRHRNLVEQAVVAEAAGFTSVHLGEHHFCDYILSSPPVVLAAIAERTITLRLSTGVALGVNLDPVRLAEDYATVDVLSGGRVEPCIGRGTFFPHTFAAFGQDPRTARDVFAENLEILIRLWTEERVTTIGRHRSSLTDVTVMPRPVQQPRPPIWAGVGASADSIELAARLGLRLMLPTVFGTIDIFRRAVEIYLHAWDSYGHSRSAMRIGACHHTFVHSDSATARARWEPRYRAYIEWVNELQFRSTGGRSKGLGDFDFDALTGETVVCGSPTSHRTCGVRSLLERPNATTPTRQDFLSGVDHGRRAGPDGLDGCTRHASVGVVPHPARFERVSTVDPLPRRVLRLDRPRQCSRLQRYDRKAARTFFASPVRSFGAMVWATSTSKR